MPLALPVVCTANVQFTFFLHELLRVENAKSSQFHWLRPMAIGLYGEAGRFYSPGSHGAAFGRNQVCATGSASAFSDCNLYVEASSKLGYPTSMWARKAISRFIGRRRIIDSGKSDRNSKSSSRRALASQWHPSEPRMDANTSLPHTTYGRATQPRLISWTAPLWNGFVVKRRLVVATVARRWMGRVFHALASVATSKWRCPVRLGTFDAQEFAHHKRKSNVCSAAQPG